MLIDRYLFWQLLKWTAVFVLVLVHAVVFAGMALLVSQVIEHNLPFSTIWIAYFGLLPNALYLTLPLCTALAVFWVYGQLWSTRALPVLYASGISTVRLAAPAIVVAFVASLGGALVGHFWAPVGAAALEDTKHLLRHGGAVTQVRPGRFTTISDGPVVLFFQRWARPGVLLNPLLHDGRDKAMPVVITAKEADATTTANYHILVFRNGYLHQGRGLQGLRIVQFGRIAIKVRRKPVPPRTGRPPYELDTSVLMNPPANWVDDPRMVNDARSELQKRFVIPLLAFVLSVFVLGAMLLFVPGSQRPVLRQAVIGLTMILGNISIIILVDTGARYSHAIVVMTYVICALVVTMGAAFIWIKNTRAFLRRF